MPSHTFGQSASLNLEERTPISPRKRPRSPSLSTTLAPATSPLAHTVASPSQSPKVSKKLKLHSSFVDTSPFPTFAHPTPAEAREVHKLLLTAHRPHEPIRRRPLNSNNSAGTCGNVPNVIEALIGTILSQNTSGQNCHRAKTSLDAAFGRNNFAAIAEASRDRLVDAIRSGGLANKKAATIQNILHSIRDKHGEYSLQHFAATESSGQRMSDDEIMKELISYDGVGPKTASCVLLFCLGRNSFAVDTHVFRLSELLGWVPLKSDRVLAQAHLDIRVPDELKYDLHVLMIQHGRSCKGCKKTGSGQACILKTYLKEKEVDAGSTNQD